MQLTSKTPAAFYVVKVLLILFAFSIFLSFVSCKKTNTTEDTTVDSTVTPRTGPVSEQELLSVPPPTFDQVVKAYNDVIKEAPELENNEPELFRAIFTWIKKHPDGRLNREQSDIPDSFTGGRKLNDREWKLFKEKTFSFIKSALAAQYSEELRKNAYPCDMDKDNVKEFDNSKGNAIQHSYWNALLVKYTSYEFAEEAATKHEPLDPSDPSSQMDLHNNKVGRDLAKRYPEATREQLLELLMSQRFVYVPAGQKIPADTDGLVYILARRVYDGTFTGSMSNPDSGGPWNASFDFNQCGNIIRGQYTVTRAAAIQKRRFTGKLNSDGSITLDISDPYFYENPENLQYCTNSAMALIGTAERLTGKWTSSNCSKGGVVTLSR